MAEKHIMTNIYKRRQQAVKEYNELMIEIGEKPMSKNIYGRLTGES